MVEIAVAAISGVTVTLLGAFWLAHQIVKATLADEERAEEREEAKTPMEPAKAKALRCAVEKKRAILEAERELWFESWSDLVESGKEDARRQLCWTNAMKIDEELRALADEEGRIPLYDEKDVSS